MNWKSKGRPAAGKLEKATFAGGCFWCMEAPFDTLPGVVSVTVGYAGGTVKNPTYEQVSAGGTGHAEAVQGVYDLSKTGYAELLEIFWRNIDPTVKDRQFCDVGSQYRTAIFYHSEEQRLLAEKSTEALAKIKPFPEPTGAWDSDSKIDSGSRKGIRRYQRCFPQRRCTVSFLSS